MRRVLRTALIAAGVFALTGCFSTIPPDVTEPTGGNDDTDNKNVVEGIIKRSYGPGDRRSAPHWVVQVKWFGGDRTGDGIPDQIVKRVKTANRDGYYKDELVDREDVTSVWVLYMRCDYISGDQDNDCCLDPTPCPQGCAEVWTARFVKENVVHGQDVHIDLVVPCGSN